MVGGEKIVANTLIGLLNLLAEKLDLFFKSACGLLGLYSGLKIGVSFQIDQNEDQHRAQIVRAFGQLLDSRLEARSCCLVPLTRGAFEKIGPRLFSHRKLVFDLVQFVLNILQIVVNLPIDVFL